MSALRSARRGEDGQAIVMVLALVVIILAFGIAVLAGALSAGQLTSHDMRVRRAQQAADAGVQSQLYEQSENNLGASYNLTGGILGLGNFLDCLPLQVNVNLQVAGVASAQASTAGICPTAINSSTGKAVTPSYTPLDNQAYVESEYISNTKTSSTGGLSGVEFPEIVSIGCNSATGSTCGTASSSNVYSRQLALLAPTGPVQAVEGMGNVNIVGISLLGINAAAVINGDVTAGGTLSLPLLGVAVNTTWPTSGNPLFPTFGYVSTPAPLSITTAKVVQLTGGFCTTGSPNALCMIKRPAPVASNTTCAACSTGISCSSCTGGGYSSTNDTFTLTGGTATFAPGDYEFCNFNATGGTVNATASSSTPVRIFILAPNQPPCNGYTYTAAQEIGGKVGDFNASQGFNNGLLGLVDGVSNTLDPSGLQIYLEGDGSYDNATSVSIGNTETCTSLNLLGVCLASTAPPAGMIVYAPTSSVNVSTKSCLLGLLCAGSTFSGSIVGDNVTVTATAITQDLDLGNYPIYSGANSYRVAEEVSCDNSVTSLGGTSVRDDTSGC
jgi:hypothetical protein